MLKRKALDDLGLWKSRSDRNPLIVEGARQVGKTYAVRAFAEAAYESVYELNFLERDTLKSIFDGDLSADAILTGIRLNYPEKRFSGGRTLLFLDEIQACPRAITALKFLSGDERFDVICSGSALGMLHGQVDSWPVGQVDYLHMTALDFEEFLWAAGLEEDIVETVRAFADGAKQIPEAIHKPMMQYFRQYLAIGGMPDVVKTFFPDRDYAAADAVQRRIYRDYVADIAHYAEAEIRLKAQKCWQSIPLQLSKQNHKFQYATVEHRGNAHKFGSSVDWLLASEMAMKVNNVSQIEYPLSAFETEDHFRIYPTDIGLLICTYDFSLKRALLGQEDGLNQTESIVLKTAKGGIYEALAADILWKRGIGDLRFYRNTPGTVEIEFLIEGPDGVTPIEIKAGNNKTRSLDTVLQNPDIAAGYKFADQNAGISGKKITLPLYMLMFFPIGQRKGLN
ncbi:MAG: ATP-binding protein [Clostridia bacterium]|nr:ATP-binding protein [Clostridia bacterium]